MRYLSLIAKNALRNKRRSILTICSIAASLCLLGVLFAIYNAFYLSGDDSDAKSLRLVTRNKVSLTVPMPYYYGAQIGGIPGVKAVAVSQWFGGTYKDERDQNNFFARFAVEPEAWFQVRPDFVLPEEQKKAFIAERTACMLGKRLADRLAVKVGDRLTLKGDIFPGDYEFTVRAIYTGVEDDETMFFQLKYLFESLPAGRRDFAGTFTILVDSLENVEKVQRAVDARYENASVQTRTETESQFAMSFLSFLGNVKLFLLSICGAVTFTILLVSANTMAMSVRERVREVGVLKTLGFSSGAVLWIIMAEAAFISLLGGVLGCLLASVLCIGVRSASFFQQLRNLSLEPHVALVCLGVAAVIGLVSSYIPARAAARTGILDALRYTG